MIGYYKDEQPFHFNIGQALCGRAFDRVELTRHDFHFFFEMKDSPTQAAMILDWLSQNVYCRLTAPPQVKTDLECYFTQGCDGKIIRSHSWETYCSKCNKGAEG
jgi:hypothetical protein